MTQKQTNGFTLIELLVVIAIISILASIITPVFSKARERARESDCINHQRQIAAAMVIVTQEEKESYPDSVSVWTRLNIADKRVYRCKTKGKAGANAYVYSAFVAGKSLGQITDPVEEILTADGETHSTTPGERVNSNTLLTPADLAYRHSEGTAFIAGFCDGHVAVLKEPPPMWIIDVINPVEYEQEVLKSNYPVVVFCYTDSTSASPTEITYCQKLDPVIQALASEYRLKVKIVRVNGILLPDLVKKYGVIPGDSQFGYPTVLFMKQGKQQSALSGFPSDVAGWTDDDWELELTLCQRQVRDLIIALLK